MYVCMYVCMYACMENRFHVKDFWTKGLNTDVKNNDNKKKKNEHRSFCIPDFYTKLISETYTKQKQIVLLVE